MYGIDLFAGAGGMSLGATESGIPVSAAIEKDRDAGLTYAANHPATHLITADIASLSEKSILALRRDDDDELVLFGGPPCQGFSYSNPRHRHKTTTTNWLFAEFLRYAQVLQPTWVVFENVRGLVDTANGYFLNRVISGLKDLGLQVAHDTVNAKDFGVPQDRGRHFIVAYQPGKDYSLPTGYDAQRQVTVDDAIRDLPILQNGHSENTMSYGQRKPSGYGRRMRKQAKTCNNNLVTRNSSLVVERYSYIPPGGNWQKIPPELMSNYSNPSRCHTGIYHRLRAEQPSVVIGNYRKNMLIHPSQDRGLSVREAARLQSFPDSYIFHGSIGFQQQQVGNAVPPLLAQAVFESIQAFVV